MGTYSFTDVNATLIGPGGAITLGSSAGVGEEGIETSMIEDKNTMTIGADGTGMQSLHAGNAGKITVRLLKTSPTNSLLTAMYNFQKGSSANWGQNVLTITNAVMGDLVAASQVSFTKFPTNKWSKDGNILEWEFDAVNILDILGSGAP